MFMIVGPGKNSKEICHRRRGNPCFLSVEDIIVIYYIHHGADAIQVAAGIGFSHADSADFMAFEGFREIFGSNLIIPETIQKISSHERLHSTHSRKRQ